MGRAGGGGRWREWRELDGVEGSDLPGLTGAAAVAGTEWWRAGAALDGHICTGSLERSGVGKGEIGAG